MSFGDFLVPVLCSETGGDLACNHAANALELLAWHEDRPERAFVYVNEGQRTAITWMGSELGSLQFGRPYRSGFNGGERVPFSMLGTNGVRYRGTYFRSSGDYARVWRVR